MAVTSAAVAVDNSLFRLLSNNNNFFAQQIDVGEVKNMYLATLRKQDEAKTEIEMGKNAVAEFESC